MPSEYYALGHSAGLACASACRKEILRVGQDQMPKMAGDKMLNIQKQAKEFYVIFESWQTGFWTGFMDRAEDMRGTNAGPS